MFIHPNRFPFSPILSDLLGSLVCIFTSWLPSVTWQLHTCCTDDHAIPLFHILQSYNILNSSVWLRAQGYIRWFHAISCCLCPRDQNVWCNLLESTWLELLGKLCKGAFGMQCVVQAGLNYSLHLPAPFHFQLCHTHTHTHTHIHTHSRAHTHTHTHRWSPWSWMSVTSLVDVRRAIPSESAESWSWEGRRQTLSLGCTIQFSISCERDHVTVFIVAKLKAVANLAVNITSKSGNTIWRFLSFDVVCLIVTGYGRLYLHVFLLRGFSLGSGFLWRYAG